MPMMVIVTVFFVAYMAELVASKARRRTIIFMTFAPMPLIFCFAPVTVLGALATGACAWVCSKYATVRPVKTYWLSSVTALSLVYGGAALVACVRIQNARREAPMESMVQRVLVPKQTTAMAKVRESTELEALEAKIEAQSRGRAYFLQRLHEDTIVTFVESEGFGSARMPSVIAQVSHKPNPPVPQPEPLPSHLLSSQVPNKLPRLGYTDELKLLHFNGLIDFVNVRGFGY